MGSHFFLKPGLYILVILLHRRISYYKFYKLPGTVFWYSNILDVILCCSNEEYWFPSSLHVHSSSGAHLKEMYTQPHILVPLGGCVPPHPWWFPASKNWKFLKKKILFHSINHLRTWWTEDFVQRHLILDFYFSNTRGFIWELCFLFMPEFCPATISGCKALNMSVWKYV